MHKKQEVMQMNMTNTLSTLDHFSKSKLKQGQDEF